MSKRKSTAHRRSQSRQKYVNTNDGRKVRNTAYKPQDRSLGSQDASRVVRLGAFTHETLKVNGDGSVEFYDTNGNLHRDGGPAVVNPDTGYEAYYRHGTLHRVGEAAVISDGGTAEEWFIDGLRHRSDGPAVVNRERTEWYFGGRLHREDGPAVETETGDREYWINGVFHHSENVFDPPGDEPINDAPPE